MADINNPTIIGPMQRPKPRPKRRIDFDPSLAPGTANRAIIDQRAFTAKRKTSDVILDTLYNSVAGSMVNNVKDRVTAGPMSLEKGFETIVAAMGQSGKWAKREWNPAEHREIFADIPREYWDGIVDQATVEGATISANRVRKDLQTMQRLGMDRGAQKVVGMATSLLDVDLPLLLASGGGVGAVKAAGRAAYLARSGGVRVAERVGAAAGGAVAGAQVGAAIGLLGAAASDTKDWTDGIDMLLTTTAFGTTLGAIAPRLMMPMQKVRGDFIRRVREGDPSIFDESRLITTDAPITGTEFRKPVDLPEGTILDETGGPLTLYHGTKNEFTAFKDGVTFHTSRKSLATEHAIRPGQEGTPRVLESNIAVQRPLEINAGAVDPDVYWLQNSMSLESRLAAGEHDSIMIHNDAGELLVVTTRGDQVAIRPVDEVDVPAFHPNAEADDSINASRSQMQGPAVFPALTDPAGRMSDSAKQIIQGARQVIWSTGFDTQVKAALKTAWGKLDSLPVLGSMLNIGTSNVARMWKSGSAVANYMAHSIFEIPGRLVSGVPDTAAMLKEMYHGRLSTMLKGEQDFLHAYAKDVNGSLISIGSVKVGANAATAEQFYKEVMLEMNSLNMSGRSIATNVHVRNAAKMYADMGVEALGILRGRAGEIAVRGAENIPDKTAYFPYRHNGDKMLQLIDEGTVTKSDLIDAYTEGYMRAGQIQDRKLAKEIAEALVTRFLARGTRVDESVVMLFSGDGREFLSMQLRANGLPERQIQGIMKRFDTEMRNRGTLGNLKHRNELDLSTTIKTKNGQVVRLVDLMDSNLSDTMHRYVREVAGSAALARKGIKSRAERTEFIAAMQAEQRALGEEVMDGDLVRAMLSEFDGGPQWGYAAGRVNRGIGGLAEVKSLTSLATLTFNGFAQLAETGMGIVAIGAQAWYTRGIAPLVDGAIKRKNIQVLDELAYLTGEIGNDQAIFRPHRHLDEAAEYSAKKDIIRHIARKSREVLSNANYIQGFTSMLNTVRGHQQKVAALGMMDKVLKAVRAGDRGAFEQGGRAFQDLGLDVDHMDALRTLIDNGVIEFATVKTPLGPVDYVNRLNFDQWDAELADAFAAGTLRSVHQQVQKSLAGESDRWMHTEWGSAITQLQTFPMLAIQKQFIRNGQHMDAQAVASALAGFGSAWAAIKLKDQFTGTERSEADTLRAAFGYSNMLGWMPFYTDPVMGILGLEDLKVNQFGAYSKPLSIPSMDTLNKLSNVPAALADMARGEDSWEDRQSIRTIPFFRLVESVLNIAGIEKMGSKPKKEAKPAEEPQVEAVPVRPQGIAERVRSILNN